MYYFKDYITGEKLTAENCIRCLNGYLDKVKVVDKDVMEDLLLYIEEALSVGGSDLANAAIDCIRVELMNRYC